MQTPRYEPLIDPSDPDDYRPNSALAFVIDSGDDSGARVRGLSLIFERIAPGDRIPLHRHPFEEAIVFEAGEAEVRMGEDVRQVGPGTIVLFREGYRTGLGTPAPGISGCTACSPRRSSLSSNLDRNPVPGTEADPPRPPWWIDPREALGS